MPNITRRPRSRLPEHQSSRVCDSGTHLTYEERCHIYSLSQYSRWSQRAIATTLRLPRSTVQSVIYAMTRTSKKRQDGRPRLITPVRKPALATTTSISAIYTSATQMQPDIQQPSLYYPAGAAPTVPSLSRPIPDDHHRQPPQPAVAASGGDTVNPGIERNGPTNSLQDRWVDVSTGCFDVYHQFSARKDASVGPSLSLDRRKLIPIEPRVVYESSTYHTLPSRQL
jgi:hypothetical protein